jgi:hypothetical protein
VEQASRITLKDLLAREMVEVSDLLVACGSGEPKGSIASCRGVLLTDILGEAGVIVTDHNDTKKMFVVASSADGYTTVFSWQELFNTAVGEGVLVVLERDGSPVHHGQGQVDLISARDFLTGPRYVKRLANLKVVMVE